MKFLIAGYGSIGRRHLRNLRALQQNDIMIYRTGKSSLPVDELDGIQIETDLEKALAQKPDAVIVANPTAAHLEVAIPAAQAGCHLLIEKPISHSQDKIGELQQSLSAGGGKVLVGYQFRFHPGLLQVERLLNDSAIGLPLSVRAHWGEYLPGWHPWEDYRKGYSARSDLGGGVVLTLSHPIDYLHWLFGDIEAVWAFTGRASPLELQVEDFAEAGLRFTSGLHGTLHLDYFQCPAQHRLEVIGSRGTIIWDSSDGAVHLFRMGAAVWEDFPVPEGFDRNELFLAELRHFIRIAQGIEQSRCTLQDGIFAIRLSLAILESAREEKLVHLAV